MLYDWQTPYADAAHGIWSRHNSVLAVLPPGAGKTYVACEVLGRRKRANLVFCPKSVIPAWQKVFEAFGLGEFSFAMNYEQLTSRSKYAKSGELGNWKTRGKHTIWEWHENMASNFDVVFDESHRTNGRDSKAGELVIACARQRVPHLFLTATPADDPLKMKALGISLGLFEREGFWNWAWGHGVRKSPFHQGYEFPTFSQRDREEAAMHLERIHADVFPARGVFMTSEELMRFFPEGHIYLDRIELPDEAKFYKENEAAISELEAAVEAAEVRVIEQLRIHQELEYRKVAVFAEQARDLLDQGFSVPCFVTYRKTAEALAKELKCLLVIGEQSDHDRQKAIGKFQDNQERALVLTSAAGGEAISLHDLQGGHPRVSLISPIWNPVQLKQVLGRIHRAGGKTAVTQKILVSKGEEKIYRRCLRRLRNMGIMSGDIPGFQLEEL